MDLELAGKVAVVTGATSGIGLAIAHRLIAEGAAVSICARGREGLAAAVGALREAGGAVVGAVADVTEPAHLERFVDDTAYQVGRLDYVVANAGGSVGGSLLKSSPEDWLATYNLNVLHAATLMRAATPHLRKDGGGSAVLVTSISGWKPAAPAQYSTAKAAEIQLASVLARELAPQKIRVNAVSPGSILAPGNGWDTIRSKRSRQFDAFVDDNLPGLRLGTPEEVADVVAFLLSPRASWVNGAHLAVDGAQDRPTMRPWTE